METPEAHPAFDTLLFWTADDGAWVMLYLKAGCVVEKHWIPQVG